jgi:hypothetical protein
MTAKELLKSKWHQFVFVNKLMGLHSQKCNKLVTADLHCLMMMIIIILSLLLFFFPYPFLTLCSLSPQSTITNLHNLLSLQSLIYTTSSHCTIPSSKWLVDGYHTAVHVFCCCGKLKFSEISNFHDLKKPLDIWDHKLNSVGHQDRVLKTHENGTNRIPNHNAHKIHVLCSVELSLLYILRNRR